MQDKEMIDRFIQIAREEGISIEALLERIERRNQIIRKVPKFQRLTYLENLVKTGEIGSEFMDTVLRIHPITPKETAQHFISVREEMQELFGIEIPKYRLRFKKSLGRLNKASGETNCEDTIWLPYHAGQFLPISISHEQAHSYHAENSALYALIRSFNKSELDKISEIKSKAQKLIEGWATFASLHYSRERDRRLGKSMYEQLTRNAQIWGEFVHKINNEKTTLANYYEGLKLYEGLFSRKGLSGVLYAVNTFTSDEELVESSNN